MKYLALVAALLFSTAALAEDGVFKPSGSTTMEVGSASVDLATMGGGFDYATHYDATGVGGTGGQLRFARFLCEAACFIAISPSGQTPDATAATGHYLAAGVAYIFAVPRFANVSAIQVSSGGGLYISGLDK